MCFTERIDGHVNINRGRKEDIDRRGIPRAYETPSHKAGREVAKESSQEN